MRGLARLAGPESVASSRTYATFSGGGRGRGRGSGLPPAPPPPRVPGQPDTGDVDDAFISPAIGRGRGAGPHTLPLPSSPFLPPSGSGRGRGGPQHQLPPAGKQPVFFRRDEVTSLPSEEEMTPLPPSLAQSRPSSSGRGRGIPLKPGAEPETKPPQEVNRHLRPRPPVAARDPAQPRLSVEDAIKRAREALSRGAPTARGRGRGRGRGGRAGMRGRGGRGRGRGEDTAEELELFLGDNAGGERLEKRLGEANINMLAEGFEELSWRVLPSPAEDAYLDALHTNNMIEYEPEYLMQFDTNPDIDEKPPMSLEEYLEKAKPFLMAYEGIQSQEEWEEIIKETMEKVPYMKELMDMYCGPDRVTAKQQQQELERVAKTLPENIPSSVKRFTDRALLSLQSNPGWGFDKKCQFMDKLVWEVSQQYK